MYVSIKYKFVICFLLSLLWAIFSVWVALPWLHDLANLTNWFVSIFVISGISIIPGFMNFFICSSLLFDKRPKKKSINDFPPITILIASYNESNNIVSTIKSIANQNYPGGLKVIVIDDGSTDDSVSQIRTLLPEYPWLTLLSLYKNGGKANALNKGLKLVTDYIVITVDADCYLYKNALKNLVLRFLSDPPTTAAIAGSVLVRNSRTNIVTKSQEWDYFLGIGAVKRMQSLFQGTLVAQGAFSLYKTHILKRIGGWKDTVGEDIVLTWDLLIRDYRIGFCEDAYCFTNAPTSLGQFIKQRQRWSRGLIETFKVNWKILFKSKFITLIVWWNLFFPYLDLVFTLFFIPGIIIAFFGYYFIAGPLTILLIPMAIVMNYIIFKKQIKTFRENGLKVRKNLFGLMVYTFFYSMILQPAAVFGYIKEIFNLKKSWGTK